MARVPGYPLNRPPGLLVPAQEKAKIQNDITVLSRRLAQLNESLARKIASRNEYDKVIQVSRLIGRSHGPRGPLLRPLLFVASRAARCAASLRLLAGASRREAEVAPITGIVPSAFPRRRPRRRT